MKVLPAAVRAGPGSSETTAAAEGSYVRIHCKLAGPAEPFSEILREAGVPGATVTADPVSEAAGDDARAVGLPTRAHKQHEYE